MPDLPLEPEELAAIQDAIREARASDRHDAISEEEVLPLTLIADDRAAETARPTALWIAERWAAFARRRLRHFIPGELEINVVNSETIDGAVMRDELAGNWISCIQPEDRPGPAMMAASGAMIELLAARLLGADEEEDEEDEEDEERRDRLPSPTALSLFKPVGDAIADSLVLAWKEEQSCDLVRIDEEDVVESTRRTLIETDVVIAATLSISGAMAGRLRLFARPSTLVPPPAAMEAVPAPVGAIDEALGGVALEVLVEFGRVLLPMRDVNRLEVGSIIPLHQFIDAPLPVQCAGVVKTHGRAVVYRGVLAVEVTPDSEMPN